MEAAQIEVVAYDPSWPGRFEKERSVLAGAFLPLNVRIEHIGSTAVLGLGAKPIIDMMLGVEQIAEVQSQVARLKLCGYLYRPELELQIPERRFFAKPPTHPRRFHLHVVEYSSTYWASHLLFRNFLRTHPEIAADYLALKLRLATQFANDRLAYTSGKSAFIEAALDRARATDSNIKTGSLPSAGIN
jgi:GrpB-like predicted nucleotidyltransferase (UPF0157 family)